MKFRGAKADRNQPQIVKAYREIGAVVNHVHQVKNLFDLVVCYNSETYLVEIKDGEKFPQKFWKMSDNEKDNWIISQLTDGEKKCKEKIESSGVKYHIVYDIDSALKILGIAA